MMHAIPYIVLALIYVAEMFDLGKDLGEALKAAIYFLMGVSFCAVHLKNFRVGRWIGVLALIFAFQSVDVSRAARGDDWCLALEGNFVLKQRAKPSGRTTGRCVLVGGVVGPQDGLVYPAGRFGCSGGGAWGGA